MKRTYILLTCLLLSFISFGQKLYIKTFGDSKADPIIFLHGGPGYNCAGFEATTAQRLADNGFFVIVYDRRGEGRSTDPNAKFNFQQTFEDINEIYKSNSLKKASFIGHSFGGIVALLFAEKFPDKIKSVFLTGVPVSLQESFKTIINHCKEIYLEKKDSSNLGYIKQLENMDTASLEYSTYCFGHAMQNGFYNTKNPSAEAKNISTAFRKDTLARLASQMTYQGPQAFWKNEHYTTLDQTPLISKLLKQHIKIFGFYGKEDGLYSPEQVVKLQGILGNKNIEYLDNCSHNVFIDQQSLFINRIKDWNK